MPWRRRASPAAASRQAGAFPATVRLAEAQSKALRQHKPVVGRLRELKKAVVAAEVEGKILEVPVETGDRVVGGETVLARIDGIWAEQNLKRAQAQVAAAQATLDQSELDLKYLENLLKAQSAKPKEVDDTRAQVASDRATLSAAIAERDRVEREVERLVVLAPFDGRVSRKITEVGQWVAPGDDIVEVISHGQIDAVVNVPERMVDNVKTGDKAQVQIDPLGVSIEGEIIAINPDGQNLARSFPVKIRLDDQDGRLKAGMTVTVWLPVGPESQYITVPPDAVYYDLTGERIWISTPPAEEGAMPTAMPVMVKPLFVTDNRVVVEPVAKGGDSMLQDKTAVIVEGVESLYPGQPLIDADAPPPPPPPAG